MERLVTILWRGFWFVFWDTNLY